MTQQNQNFCTPFREFLGKDRDGFFRIRLGPKTYLVKTSKRIDQFFNWNAVLVIDPKATDSRTISHDELAKEWVKLNLKAMVNYQIAIKENTRNSIKSKYDKDRRRAFRN
jgi:hypothetical protein